MPNNLKTTIQEAFSEVYTIQELVKLYAEIQVECQIQLDFMAEKIKKEVVDNA